MPVDGEQSQYFAGRFASANLLLSGLTACLLVDRRQATLVRPRTHFESQRATLTRLYHQHASSFQPPFFRDLFSCVTQTPLSNQNTTSNRRTGPSGLSAYRSTHHLPYTQDMIHEAESISTVHIDTRHSSEPYDTHTYRDRGVGCCGQGDGRE